MAQKKKQVVYDESKIKTLSSLEHIRLRTGMYIGRTGDGSDYDDGIYILVKEVIDNAIDEFIMGHGNRVTITLKDNLVTVRDYGRGIPLGKVVDCVSRINTGAKYNDDVFQFSVGLNGVGTKAVNALSSHFLVRSVRDTKGVEASFTRGELLKERKIRSIKELNGTYVEFTPDPEIFGDCTFNEEHLRRRLMLYAYLNPELKIKFNGELFISQNGLMDLIRDECQYEKIYPPFHFREKTFEFAFTHTNRFSEEYYSFVNGQFTTDGGTHLSAFREGLLKGINEYAKKRFEGEDVREGLVGAVAIRLKDPIFESQTKNKLGNTEIRAELVSRTKKMVEDLLHRDRKKAEKLLQKIEDTTKLRKELQTVKKVARERAKAVSIHVPQLKDCKLHRGVKGGEKSHIFITEGQSAAGSLVSCRDAKTQAIFTLKGKPLNVCSLGREALYKNIELYNLMRALDIEESCERLRYEKVVLATDADVDGLHIRNLMVTFFLRFFAPMVDRGHVQILETPLFRVRTKKETIYCYSERERNAAMKKLGKGSEVTRFKGLGEISPGEFKQFIGSGIRLTKITTRGENAVGEVMEFYMGKNTQERRQYIMENLVPSVAAG
ncbi:MAG: ATP-binding protein [Kiritimatiellae bacterium]|nr:ATP-binding protein [Kiritimatiellia bacterium]